MRHPKAPWGSQCSLVSHPWQLAPHKLVLQLAWIPRPFVSAWYVLHIQHGINGHFPQCGLWNPVPHQGCYVLHCGPSRTWWFIWPTTTPRQPWMPCISRRNRGLLLFLWIFAGWRWIPRGTTVSDFVKHHFRGAVKGVDMDLVLPEGYRSIHCHILQKEQKDLAGLQRQARAESRCACRTIRGIRLLDDPI